MKSRFIPITAFIIWSAICWNWYVCGIKEQCTTAEAGTPAVIQPVATAPPAIDTAGQFNAQNAIQPTSNNNSSAATASKNVQKSLTNDIESAQIVAVADRVLIHFPYGSARRIDDDTMDAYLSELAAALINTGDKVTLIGHADGIGEKAWNKALSLQRAKHIKASLVKKGVKSSQITVKNLGESQPVATNDNPQGRYRNRRVEVRLDQ